MSQKMGVFMLKLSEFLRPSLVSFLENYSVRCGITQEESLEDCVQFFALARRCFDPHPIYAQESFCEFISVDLPRIIQSDKDKSKKR